MSGIAGRRWKDLTPEQTVRRQAWSRGGQTLPAPGDRLIPVDPEVRRIADGIRARVRAQRMAEGRV